ncbi:MAG: nuclear transport factor 2 family protein [Pseudomonadota bacterium]|jgi:hypothetical protein|uniref:Nuclear transport factor 2 family protein n=1 Tax=Caldimonas thermodepolymerans TaxID=215580 RepID=A0AA46HV78_9BURK|nr:nuclear transport factor 2 family protein [Caldimonas thermodepolymerans]TCP06539.1 hypothetical protein EV676_10622 [Caldimonas thermodepolymerans]UZG49402.1 nuclear transport factor 2 family protein [Caldimonas thermodepolymerans]
MTSIHHALDDLLNRQDIPLDTFLDWHFSPDYRQRTDGHWDDRNGFAAHARRLRELVASARIEVLDEWRDLRRYASHHRVHVRKRDGATVVQEVYLFARLDASGRFECVDEVTLMLEGQEADRGLGRVR